MPQTAHSSPVDTRMPLGGEVGHYENFPVASVLCPPRLRPAVTALYHFARTADDIADEGPADAPQRLADLGAYRASLDAALAGQPVARWAGIFGPLAKAVQRHALPPALLHDLISAFEQDVRHTASGHRYANHVELLAYCRLSANPVGRLLLHLYGVTDARALQQSDQICSALQLINFWQDISVDLPRQRHYLPADALAAHDLTVDDFTRDDPALDVPRAALVRELCDEARALMLAGAPLVRQVPGRAGWELRLVVHGGLRVLERIAGIDHRSWQQRVALGPADAPRLLWRAWRQPVPAA